MNSKKIITLLVLTTLLMSLVPIMTVNALTITGTYETDGTTPKPYGSKGDKIAVIGTDVTGGKNVELYWDLVQPWSSTEGAGLVNTSKAKPSGNYEVWVKIPETVFGDHYLWVRDSETKTTESYRFVVVPKLSLSATSGLVDEKLDVDGFGFKADDDIEMVFGTPPVRLIDSGDSVASWATDPATGAAKGDVVKIVGDLTSDARAGALIGSGETLTTILADPSGLGFEYFAEATGYHPDLELRFVGPGCVDPDDEDSTNRAHVDITTEYLGTVTTANTWESATTIVTTTDVWVFGNKESGEAFSTGPIDWSGINAYLSGEGINTDEWDLTRVSPQAGWGVTGTYYVDHVTIDGGTTVADLEQPFKTVTSDEFGSFTTSFKIPEKTEATYYLIAYGTMDAGAAKEFTIGACITLDVDEGPVGTVVEIKGRGFEPTETIDEGEVTIIDGGTPVECNIIDVGTTGIDIDSEGDFKLEIVVPSVDMDDYDTITVVDGGGNTASADFEVTGEPEIEVAPEYGVQGTKISIHGYNFSQIDDEEIVLALYTDVTTPAHVVDIKDFETDNDGEFEGTFIVPARTSDTYVLRALQADWDILADTDFRIGMMIVILSPADGPTGTHVTLTGTGFSEDQEWNATFGDLELIDDGDVDEDGNLELGVDTIPTFYVPTVDPGVYTVNILDINTEISVEVEFTVTDTTMVELDPPQSPQDYNVSITGKYFAADDDDTEEISLEFAIFNETDDWDMDVFQMWDHDDDDGAVTPNKERVAEVNDEGNFTAYWDFNDGDIELDTGTYTINATDSEDLFTQVTFNVVTKTTEIDSRKATFRIGDTVGFNVESSFAQLDSYIKIWAPDGELYWTTDDFASASWQKVGTIQIVPFYKQTAGENPMVLLDDAPIGTWTWKWYDTDDDKLDSGAFNVEAAAADILSEQVEDLDQAIDDLTDDISTVSDSVAGLKTDINGAVQAANSAVEASNAAIEAINAVAGQAGDAATAAQNAAEAAADAQEAASGLTTLVYGAIGASLVAALAAIVSLMQISKRIAG